MALQIVSSIDKKHKIIRNTVTNQAIDKRTSRRRFTDSVKVLVEMASFQNSSNPKMYYTAIGKLIKGITNIEDRSEATATQKALERTLQLAARGEILKGVELGVYYKNIYKNIRKKLLDIDSLLA